MGRLVVPLVCKTRATSSESANLYSDFGNKCECGNKFKLPFESILQERISMSLEQASRAYSAPSSGTIIALAPVSSR